MIKGDPGTTPLLPRSSPELWLLAIGANQNQGFLLGSFLACSPGMEVFGKQPP